MIVSDNTIQGKVFGDFFESFGKAGIIVSKKMAKIVLETTPRALDITANIATAAASRIPEGALSSQPEVINFYHTSKSLYLGQFV